MAFPDEIDLELQRDAEKVWRGADELCDWVGQFREQRKNLARPDEGEEFALMELRRKAEHLVSSAGVPVGAAVFGASQSGKSLFVGHVLKAREPSYSPLGRDEAVGEPAYYPGLSFTMDLNPQCGNLEATALVTRFTTRDRVSADVPPSCPVVALALTRADWLRVLGRGFQAECAWVNNQTPRWTLDVLEGVLQRLSEEQQYRGGRFDRQWRMDLSDAFDHMKGHDPDHYIADGSSLGSLLIRYPLSDAGYTKLAALLLWDDWDSITSLFTEVLEFIRSNIKLQDGGRRPALLTHWAGVRFLLDSQRSEQHQIPHSAHFRSLSWSQFSLVEQLGWTLLDYHEHVRGGRIDLALLQASLLELVIPVLPERLHDDWRNVLGSMDLLDIPGMRAGRDGPTSGKRETAGSRGEQMEIVKRGKVRYLFDRYVDELQVQTLLLLVSGRNVEVRGQMNAAIDRWGRARYGRDWMKVKAQPPAFLVGFTGIDDDFRNHQAHPGKVLYNNRFRQLVDTLGTVMRDFDGQGNAFTNVFPIRYPGTWDTDGPARQRFGAMKWEQARAAFLESEEACRHVLEPDRSWDAAMDDADGGFSLVSEVLLRATSARAKQTHLRQAIEDLRGQVLSIADNWVVAEGVERDRKQRANLGEKIVAWLAGSRLNGENVDALNLRIDALNQSLCLREGDTISLADLEDTPTAWGPESPHVRLRRTLSQFLQDWVVHLVPRRWQEQVERARRSNFDLGLPEQDVAQLARYLCDYLRTERVFNILVQRLQRVVFLQQDDGTSKKHARRRYAPLVLNDFVMNPGPTIPSWMTDKPIEELEYGLHEPFVRRWQAHLAQRLADGAGDSVRIPPGNAELLLILERFGS
jgi:hypothetical protein